MVNNAGIVSGSPLLDTPDGRLVRFKNIKVLNFFIVRIVKTFEVNVLAHFWTIKVMITIQNQNLGLFDLCQGGCQRGTNWLKCSSRYCIIHITLSLSILLQYCINIALTLQAFLPDMLDQSCGHIVNLASVAGQAGTNKLVITLTFNSRSLISRSRLFLGLYYRKF